MSDRTAAAQTHCQMRWRLRELMALRNHMTQTELTRALEADGAHAISRTQVGRLTARPPKAISLALIGSLCRIFDCSPDDLFGWEPAPPQADLNPLMTGIAEQARSQLGVDRVPNPPQLPDGTPRLDPHSRARVVGPTVRALPAHPLSRKSK